MTRVAQLELKSSDQLRAELEAKRDRHEQIRLALMATIRAAVRELGGTEAVANDLDAVWGDDLIGRGVSPSTFKATLATSGNERNYFRLEWIIDLAERSEEVAEALAEIAGHGRPKKTPEQELADLKTILREEYPRQAAKLIRKAETP